MISAVGDVGVGFSECGARDVARVAEEYNEGGRNSALKFPTRVSWGNLTLKKGLGLGTALWDWHYGFVTGKGKRRDGMIALLNDQRVPVTVWYFRGLPVKYSGPEVLNATQNNVAIESIEISHEGIFQLPFGISG